VWSSCHLGLHLRLSLVELPIAKALNHKHRRFKSQIEEGGNEQCRCVVTPEVVNLKQTKPRDVEISSKLKSTHIVPIAEVSWLLSTGDVSELQSRMSQVDAKAHSG
jgi:hypothetical protein